VNPTAAIDELTATFAAGFGRSPAQPPDRKAVVVSWPSVPVEAIRAAGLYPVVARGSVAPTPLADAHLEDGIFPARIRQLVEAALTGNLSAAARIVIPRTSDADYKGFLYLREFMRNGLASAALPEITLFDLLQSDAVGTRAYGRARTQALVDILGAASGRPVAMGTLREEVTRTNAARAALRRLLALRQESPRISGAQALPLLGAFWLVDPDRYVTLATAAVEAFAARTPLPGPRLLLTGAPVDGPQLHNGIESHGAVVVAEISPWGTCAVDDDVRDDGDPVEALADRYRTEALSARLPARDTRAWLDRSLSGVDGVVVSLPPDDTVFGWDYPRWRDDLNARGIPHTCLRGDPYDPMTAGEHDRIDQLVTAATRRRETTRE